MSIDKKEIEAFIALMTDVKNLQTYYHGEVPESDTHWNMFDDDKQKILDAGIDLAALYLSASEKMPEKNYYNPKSIGGQNWNEAIDLCTISHMKAMAEKDAEIERLKELQPYKDQIDAIYKLASLAKPETPEARFCETESVEIVNNIQIGRLYAELERLRKIVELTEKLLDFLLENDHVKIDVPDEIWIPLTKAIKEE